LSLAHELSWQNIPIGQYGLERALRCVETDGDILLVGQEHARITKYRNGWINNWTTYYFPDQDAAIVFSVAVESDVLVAAFLDLDDGGVMISTNGGDSWRRSHTGNGLPSNFVRDVEIVNGVIWAVGAGHFGVQKTTDYGDTWENKTPGLPDDYVYCIEIDTLKNWIWVGTSNGDVCLSENDGDDWNVEYSLSDAGITNIFLDDDRVWAATSKGVAKSGPDPRNDPWTLFTTANGLCSNINRDVLRVWVGHGPAYLSASSGGVGHTHDGGNSWVCDTDTSGIGSNECWELTSGYGGGLPDSSICWLATDGGLSYTTVYTGVDFHSGELALGFSLCQNYPNPFNASTEITFEVADDCGVKLEIFNLRGEKVETLVNGHKEAGRYSTTWSAADRASGIYFYRLSAADFTETRRMMLVK